MSESDVQARVIESEDQIWSTLEALLDYPGDDAPFELDFSQADWAKIRVVYTGEQFKSSLTPSAMRGLIEFQATLYRSAALILHDDAHVGRLTDTERERLELTFKIKDGSADTEGEGKNFLEAIAKAVSSMTSKHKLIALLVLGGMYFGTQGVKSYLEDQSSREEKTQLSHLTEQVMQHDEKTLELLARSQEQSKEAAVVRQQSAAGYDAIVKQSGQAETVTVQGTRLETEHLNEIKTAQRRGAKDVRIKEQFTVLLVDPTSKDGFRVRVKSDVTGKIFWAALYDALVPDTDRANIRQAEWSKRPIVLTITGRQVGEEIRDAQIMATSPVKAEPLLISFPTKRA